MVIIIDLDDIPVTHTYLQDSGEESDTPSTLEVLEKYLINLRYQKFKFEIALRLEGNGFYHLNQLENF